MHRIVDVTTEILADPRNPILLVRATTEDGLEGVGECWWGAYRPDQPPGSPVKPIASMVDDVLASACLGADAARREALWQRLVRLAYGYGDEGVVLSAISGIDLALWDIAGKRRGVGAVELLGGAVGDSVPVYASLPWLGDLDRVLGETKRAVEAGFRAVKLHEADPEMALAAREQVGDRTALMVDVNGHFSLAEALEVVDRFARAGITWLEEPTWPTRNQRLLDRLARRSPVPLAAGENEANLDSFRRLLDSEAITYLQPEVTRIGGLTQAAKVGALAEAAGVALCPHNYSLGPSFYASLHWAASSVMTRWLEVPWLEEDQSFPTGWQVPAVHEGRMAVPSGPGLSLPPLG